MWGSGPKDVWAAGAGTILHWGGTPGPARTDFAESDLYAVWALAADDVYAVGADRYGAGFAVMHHWNGKAWSPVETLWS